MAAMNAPEKFENIRPVKPWLMICADGVAIVQMVMEKKDEAIPQHVHAHAHHTLIARGSVRVWADGVHIGDFKEREAVFIASGVKHLFVSLEDNTVAYCIHNTRDGEIDILAEHKINAGD